MAADTFDIQKLVTESGVARRTIYFYVQQGLLPPPQGAGLAAFYTEDHLLRLQLIPILRQQGLRLDDIREKFARMSAEEMRQQVSDAAKHVVQERLEPLDFQGDPIPSQSPTVIHEISSLPPGWAEQNFIHFSLPAGITLTAPEQMNLVDRQRLTLLLQAARRIFSAPAGQYVVHEPGKSGSSPDFPGGDERKA